MFTQQPSKINELKRLINDCDYEAVIENLANIVRNLSLTDEDKITFTRTLVQELLPLPKPTLKRLLKVAYEKHSLLAEQGEAAHKQCQHNAGLLVTLCASNDVIECEQILDKLKNSSNEPYRRRDQIQSRLIAIAGVRFALEACMQKNDNSDQASSTSTMELR